MTEQDTKVHHMTMKKAERLESEGRISDVDLDAIRAGDTTIEDALAYREQQDSAPDSEAPPKPVSRISKDDTLSPCLCGCGELVPRRFKAGHDARMFRVAREHLTEGRELTDEQREYLESSGKMEHVKGRLESEEAKRQEKITAKTERQRKKEGEAERNASE